MKLIYILALASLLCNGCNKFLDKNPDPTKRVPSTLQDVDYLSNSARNGGELQVNQVADEYFIPNFKVSFNDEGRYYYKHWKYDVLSSWALRNEIMSTNYAAIQTANACLGLLESISENDRNRAQFNKVKGKCHYIRAANYLYVAWAYCQAYDKATAKTELGMPIDEDIYFGNKLTRSTLQELYDYVLKEANLAYSLLEVHYPLYGEVNKTMANALLARIHLSMRNYDSAYKYSNEAIIQKPDLLNYNNPLEVKIGTTTPFTSKNKEMIEIVPGGLRDLRRDPILNGNEFFIDSTLMASYDANDLRVQAHFSKFGRYYKHYYTFFGETTPAGPTYNNNIMMVDEMYLIRSECNARLGRVPAGIKDLNDLLITRFKTGTYLPYTTNDPIDALNIILQERRKSLVLRGLRWIDIKRLNLEGRNISISRKVGNEIFTLPANDRRFAIPLHSDLVTVWGYKQNPY